MQLGKSLAAALLAALLAMLAAALFAVQPTQAQIGDLEIDPALQQKLEMDNLSPELLPFYTTLSGTSMATPHVAGTIALMEEADPGLTPDEAKDILTNTATPMAAAEHEAGAGYLDAYEAVQAAEAS